MNVLVVVPTYNEAATIEQLLERVRSAVPDSCILVVDDGSPDGTASLARRAGERLGGVEMIERERRAGLGDAYRCGFAWGLDRGFDRMVEIDADLSHDPAALPELLAAAEQSDLVIGSRYVPGGSIPSWGLHRRLLSRWGNSYSSVMLGVAVRDMTSGYRVYRADLLRRMDLDTVRADGYGFQIEMTYRAARCGARIREVPIRFVDREAGTSKMSSKIIVEALGLVTWWGVRRRLGQGRPASRIAAPEATEAEMTTRRG